MQTSEWDIEEVKRLKKKLLVQGNLVMLLLLLLSIYYIKTGGSVTVFFGLCCVLMWIIVAHTFKTLITGKNIGTKAWGAPSWTWPISV